MYICYKKKLDKNQKQTSLNENGIIIKVIQTVTT